MVRASRLLYAVLAWAFVVGLLAQVFLIGLGLFGSSASATDLHRNFGWLLHLVPLLVLLFAALSRAGSRHWQWALALAVVVFLVPIFATLRDGIPILAALHPVAALIAFPISLVVAMNSRSAVMRGGTSSVGSGSLTSGSP
jgi:hypothetical protein